jgi:hypothetical protein
LQRQDHEDNRRDVQAGLDEPAPERFCPGSHGSPRFLVEQATKFFNLLLCEP